MLNVNEVREKLATIKPQQQFLVVFNKVDGTERKMKCWMEPESGDTNDKPYVPVRDADKDGAWRSFRLDSVVSITS